MAKLASHHWSVDHVEHVKHHSKEHDDRRPPAAPRGALEPVAKFGVGLL